MNTRNNIKRKQSPTINKEQAQQEEKKHKMSENTLSKIQQILERIEGRMDEFQQEVITIHKRIDKIVEESSATKAEVSVLKERFDVIETNQNACQLSFNNQLSTINALQQQQKATELAIHNIPGDIDMKAALSDISKWSKCDISKKTLRSSNFNKGTIKKTLYVNFCSQSDKNQFMEVIRKKQKDENGKYNPILCENVFNLSEQSRNRGTEMHFRQPMTELNKTIFNEARKHKNTFKFVWIGDRGLIMIKQEETSTAIAVHSLEHLASIVAETRNKSTA